MDELAICNLALSRLGSRQISSLTESSAEAMCCNLHYGLQRDELLRAHQWNFAKTRTTLTKLTPTPSFIFEYANAFQLPDTCLRVISINEEDVWDRNSPAYEIEGRMILTDIETVQMKYIIRITNPDFYDSIFIKAFVTGLASVMAEKLTGNSALGQALLQEKEQLLMGEAKRVDANESRRTHSTLPNANNSGFIRARFSGQ